MYIVVDDEILGARSVMDILRAMDPETPCALFQSAETALKYVKDNEVQCAFLDISMPVMNGIELARHIKLARPACNIVFTTGYDNHYDDAFRLGASDYLLKPITREKVERALSNLRNPINTLQRGLTIQCFGNFEVFFEGKPVNFKRGKTKELFAYLIYRNGAAVTKGEVMSHLWEEERDSYYGVIKKDLLDTLHALGEDHVIFTQWKTLAINKSAIGCDYYDFLKGIPSAMNRFNGEFMSQYSWGEDMEATLCGQMP